MNKNDVVVTGEWDGQKIWREKTPEEKFSEALALQDSLNKNNEQNTNNNRA